MQNSMTATRCLNDLRLLHAPTYVATRYLLESLASDDASSWTLSAISRRYPVQRSGRYLRTPVFKKRLENGGNEFREFTVPSPMTCLAETLVLESLSRLPTFYKPRFIYSYRWPTSPECPYSFEHYYRGYTERNAGIRAMLQANPRSVALVADVEKFYPSVPQSLVGQRFSACLGTDALDDGIRHTAQNLVDHLLDQYPEGKGIPTGPKISHILGDLAMRSVDDSFSRSFPDRYFRYVDDIVVVCEPEEVADTAKQLRELLAADGLVVNPDKNDVVSGEDWLAHGPEWRQTVTELSFEGLLFRIRLSLALRPAAFPELTDRFLGQGFSLPLSRLRVASSEISFRVKARFWWRKGWSLLRRAMHDTPENLAQYALAVRDNLLARLASLSASKFPQSASRRRWHVQRLRYVVNRLLYLLPPSQLGLLRAAVEPYPEFSEAVGVLDAVEHRDISRLLEMPGIAASATASLLSSNGAARLTLPQQLTREASHTAGALLLHGVADAPAALWGTLDVDTRDLLEFCAGQAPQVRQRNDFGYIDEVRSLQLQRAAVERTRMLQTRFSDGESYDLEALDLGEQRYS